jgi:hypothetical protein
MSCTSGYVFEANSSIALNLVAQIPKLKANEKTQPKNNMKLTLINSSVLTPNLIGFGFSTVMGGTRVTRGSQAAN